MSSLPQEAQRHCDAVVIGTGELGWPQLIGDAELGRLKPIYNVTDREFNLAEVPVPVFELLDRDK